MSRNPDQYNFHDKSAGTASGTVYAKVLDIKDPQKLGRVLVEIVGSGEGLKSTSECQWVTVNIPGGPTKGGAIGKSPPSSELVPTDVVKLNTLGQQTWEVASKVSKVDPKSETGDTHPFTKGENVVFNNPQHNSNPENPGYSIASDLRDLIDKTAEQIRKSDFPAWANSRKNVTQVKGDWVKKAIESMTPSDFKHRKGNRNKTKPMGLAPFASELSDATKFMQGISHPEVIQSGFSMIQNLQATARGGGNILASSSVGGLTNITNAIASALSHVNKITKENDENDEDPLEAYLRALYREETGLEPLDSENKETQPYKDWKVDYYLREEYTAETGLEARDENLVPTLLYKAWKLIRLAIT